MKNEKGKNFVNLFFGHITEKWDIVFVHNYWDNIHNVIDRSDTGEKLVFKYKIAQVIMDTHRDISKNPTDKRNVQLNKILKSVLVKIVKGYGKDIWKKVADRRDLLKKIRNFITM